MSFESIFNYVQLTEMVGTSGQPTVDQFKEIAESGFNVVINLAMHNSDNAIKNEGNIVTSYGMSYVHIPVPFDEPTMKHLQTFEKVMNAFTDQKIWVHCVMNYRVSAFMYHYLRSHYGYTPEQARSSIFDEWNPDKIWKDFLAIEHSTRTKEPPDL